MNVNIIKEIIMILNKWSNQSIKVLIILMFPLFVSCNEKKVTEPEQEPEPLPGADKILFIGSSYFSYNNLTGMFATLTQANNKNIFIDYSIVNGTYLEYHASNPSTLDKINKRDWDYVVLQGVGTLMAYPDVFTDHPAYPALVTLHNKISTNSESTKMMFCLPWAYEDGMAWAQGWTDLYDDMQKKIYKNTLAYADEIGFIIAPVGMAWYRVLEEKNYPLHYLHLNDWNHPSLRGSYLTACVIYSTIFQESSSGIEYYADIPKNEALYFQDVASSTVLDSLQLWNIVK